MQASDEEYYTPSLDAESGNRLGIDPSLWGTHVWEALHFITLGYPESNPSRAIRRSAYDFIFSLQHLLPCGLCRSHLAQILQTNMPLTDEVLSTRKAFGEYVVRLRDYIKRMHVLPPRTEWPVHTFDKDVVKRLLLTRRESSVFERVSFWGIVIVILLLLVNLWMKRR